MKAVSAVSHQPRIPQSDLATQAMEALKGANFLELKTGDTVKGTDDLPGLIEDAIQIVNNALDSYGIGDVNVRVLNLPSGKAIVVSGVMDDMASQAWVFDTQGKPLAWAGDGITPSHGVAWTTDSEQIARDLRDSIEQ